MKYQSGFSEGNTEPLKFYGSEGLIKRIRAYTKAGRASMNIWNAPDQ